MKKTEIIPINQLLPVNVQEIDHENTQTINARDVYAFLEIKDGFAHWIKDKIKQYEFIEGQDYICWGNNPSKEDKNEIISDNETKVGGHNIKEYYVTLDMAKELAMVQNNPKGKQARKYFLQCEKIAKDAILKEAKQIRREGNREWKQIRENGKVARRKSTDAIQDFCDYAISQGSKNSHWYYKSATNLIYDICIDGGSLEIQRRKKELKIKNGRDTLTFYESIDVAVIEITVSRKAVDETLDIKKEHYHVLFPILKEKILQYGAQVIKRLPLQGNQTLLP